MKRTLYFPLMLMLLSLLVTLPAAGRSYQRILRISDEKVITFAQMIKDIKEADLVFVGENHDNKRHHEAQLDVIKSLGETDTPVAIGLEMFRANNQQTLHEWVTGKVPLDDFLRAYYDNWNFPWPTYSAIFLYAKEHRIPLIGLNVSRAITQKVSEHGFASLSPAERRDLPPDISCDIDEQYMDFIRRAYEAHAHAQNSKSFVRFCEAQMLWDKTMAWHLMGFLKGNPDRTVVVLAGTGHAWKRGIPEQIRRQSNYNYKVILPHIPGRIEQGRITSHDADYILLD